MPEIVNPDILDADLAAHPVPEPELGAGGARGIVRRGEDEGALSTLPPVENAPGPGVQRNRPGSGLAVLQGDGAVPDLGPAQPHDLALAASGQQKESDVVGLVAIALSGLAHNPAAVDRPAVRDRPPDGKEDAELLGAAGVSAVKADQASEAGGLHRHH